mmetsp:Transcript_35196/g.56912  ORF Transcript_35196/g.56912 Transcript_35196/m.56912 type:complete len:99 (-) Transcript_35196:304-600(-)
MTTGRINQITIVFLSFFVDFNAFLSSLLSSLFSLSPFSFSLSLSPSLLLLPFCFPPFLSSSRSFSPPHSLLLSLSSQNKTKNNSLSLLSSFSLSQTID